MKLMEKAIELLLWQAGKINAEYLSTGESDGDLWSELDGMKTLMRILGSPIKIVMDKDTPLLIQKIIVESKSYYV